MKDVAIYIPAFNAATTIRKVLDRIPADLLRGVAEILIVDNHSTDGTDVIVNEYAEANGLDNVNLLRTPENLGYGGSQKLAYRHCIQQQYACVAMLHGDAQYAPELIGSLLDPVLGGAADLVFGSRMRGRPLAGGMPIHRFIGNRALTAVQNRLLGTRLSEFHSGYRAFSVDSLRQIPFERLSSAFHFDTEVMILMLEHGLRIAEVPIPTHYGEEKSNVNVWRYGIDVLVTTLSFALHKRGLRRSANWSRILA